MSTVADFNRIDDCNKIDPQCIDGYTDVEFDETNDTGICIHTPWGGMCLDLTNIVKAAETCTTLYLSPEDDPNCLVYEPECGDNICIHGDDLSKIISMKHLKDVSGDELYDGAVYMYNGVTKIFEPFDLKAALNNLSIAVSNVEASLSNIINRIIALENKLVPPAGAPDDVKIVFGNTNMYADTSAVVDSSGVATTLDKTHGLYSHALSTDVYGDEIFG